DDPRSVAAALALSRETFGLIRQNLALSTAYNLVAVPLAVAGLVIPAVAAASMSLSSLLVVGNALRRRRGRTRGALPERARPGRIRAEGARGAAAPTAPARTGDAPANARP